MNNKAIYYRPTKQDAELLSLSDAKRLQKVWGKNQPYNQIVEVEIDQNYGTAIPIVTELMAVIQCDRRLNERQAQLEERIKRGLTPSTAYYSDYVEANLLFKLVTDARDLFVKEGGNLREAFGHPDDGKAHSTLLPFGEFRRLFGLPYQSIMKKVAECEAKIGEIERPKEIRKLKYDLSYDGDQQSVFKQYYLKGTLYSRGRTKIDLPYVCKVFQSYDGYRAYSTGQQYVKEDYIQVYVYDYYGRNWALQNVVEYLVKNKMIKLK